MRNWLVRMRGNRSQQKIADICGISQQFYSWIETGERDPSVDTAKKIAKALEFDWILFYQDDEAAATKEVI